MTIADFIAEFQDVLQSDDEITINDKLSDIEEWDSMSIMACMVWLEKRFSCKYSFTDIALLQSVKDIMALTNGKVV